ncbi:sensor histidine kinase [Sphingomonas abietis]|uniref:histidine kinase n=1 Tax=Sphingomonas abietis TaxID=3012344 RepID=A0ABY7NL39_9SPHN|nr:PAS domain-containing sensor histidine kinase [Sphingomonas abietis]WBO22223.1 PAS domain-containing sensor histidine kinase [Sphingomonas abietis]
MRSSGRFVVVVGGYLAMLTAVVLLLAWLLPQPGFAATKILLALGAAILLWQLWRQTQRTNIAIARFVSALEHGDLAQTFRTLGQGTGFDELGTALDQALRRLRQDRAADATENRFSAALADEAPTPLLTIDPAGTVRLANKAARRLFGGGDGRRTAEFDRYGAGVPAALDAIVPGERRMCRIRVGELNERTTLACTGFDRGDEHWRIVSVQIIQGELDAAEIATQSDLVRVLTHEIMNSITPVTSLAATAAGLMVAADRGDDPAIGDARMAVEALAKRAQGISHFVDSYREFSTAPALTMTRFAAKPWLDQLGRLFAAMPQASGVAIALSVQPETLELHADIDLLAQVVLNLLKNGAEASAHAPTPRVQAMIGQTVQRRTRIVIADNGPGIDDKLAKDIFLPFFTTKRSGTGVGLSFARQVVLLHHGSIDVTRGADGGAQFEILI